MDSYFFAQITTFSKYYLEMINLGNAPQWIEDIAYSNVVHKKVTSSLEMQKSRLPLTINTLVLPHVGQGSQALRFSSSGKNTAR